MVRHTVSDKSLEFSSDHVIFRFIHQRVETASELFLRSLSKVADTRTEASSEHVDFHYIVTTCDVRHLVTSTKTQCNYS